ncbi:MAG TPA: M36 family metallopeptidase, partial [Candidatus Ozemobacteraceae bacterium]|nr:M36 family metallopeptidase [Candidatus Ozemobacteraceae bacterium]
YLDMGYNRERIGVLVWAGDDLDNAYYMPWANAIYLGDGGERFFPLSREESIIYHEYAHAVVDKIQPLRGTEGSAMNEGQADYFACSFSNEPRVGEYVVSKKNRPYLRILEHALHYPEDLQHEPHDDGRIWAGTLWDIRKQLGADVTDRLILRSFFLLKEEPGYLDAILALLEADRQLNAGEHLTVIRDCFQARGYPLDAPNLFSARELKHLIRFPSLQQEDRP